MSTNNLNLTVIESQWYDRFHEKSKNYPSIDLKVDPNNITKFTYYDELLNSLKDLAKVDPEKIKHYLNEVANPYITRTFKYEDKSLYIRRRFFDAAGNLVQFNKDMVMYPLNFGHYSEDSYHIDVFLDGRKLDQKFYEIRQANSSKMLYIDSRCIGKNTEIEACINRIYNNDKIHIRFVDEDQEEGVNSSFEVGINSVGNRYYSLDNFIVYVLRKKTSELASLNHFKLLTKNEDYKVSLKDGSSDILSIEIDGRVALQEGDYIAVVNKLTSAIITHDTKDILNPVIPLVFEGVNGLSLPFPIENIFETDVFVNGYHVTPNIDYVIDWNKDSNSKPAYLRFNLPIPKDSVIEIQAISENEESVNIQKTLYNMDERGFVSLLDKKIPLNRDYLKVYVDNRRVSKDNIEVIADSILLVKGVNSISNVDIRTWIPSSPAIVELLEKYSYNESDLTQYVRSIGFEAFTTRYANLNDIKPIDVNNRVLYDIEIQLNKYYTFRNASDIEYKIIATYNDGTYQDVTAQAYPSFVNTSEEGITKMTATYVENGISKYTEVEILVGPYTEEQDLHNITIHTSKLLTGSKNGGDLNVQIIASFTNSKYEDVTKVSNIKYTVDGEFLTILASYVYRGVKVEAIKKIKLKYLISSLISHIEIIPSKKEAFVNELVTFTVVAHHYDGTSKNVTNNSIISGYVRDLIGEQVVGAMYAKEGYYFTSTTTIKVKAGITTELPDGIQTVYKSHPKGMVLKEIVESGITFKVIEFLENINDALVAIDGLFYIDDIYDGNKIYLSEDSYITQEILDSGDRVCVYKWEGIKIHKEKALINNGSYTEFETNITNNKVLFYNGVLVKADINPLNGKQVKLRGVENQSAVDPSKLIALTFVNGTESVINVGYDQGKVDYVGGKVMFAQNMERFVITYNGVDHKYAINEAKPSDIYYNGIEYLSPEAYVQGFALYTGYAVIGYYTNERLDEINKELNYSKEFLEEGYRDIITISQDGQVLFNLDFTPTSLMPVVIINGLFYNNKHKNGKDMWLVDQYNKTFIWLFTPANGFEDGFEITKDMSVIVIYDYIESRNIY